MGSLRNEYGRFQLRINEEAGTVWLTLENVNWKGEHWLTLSLPQNDYSPIGYLRLRSVSASEGIFEISEVRPASGPLFSTIKDADDSSKEAG